MKPRRDTGIAIIATLLVFELRVPLLNDHRSPSELGHHLVYLMPKFLSWLISFIIVAKFWLNHHHVLGLARHADYGMVWLNSICLMFQSFIPFPTAMMGEYPNPLAVSMFGVVMALNRLLFIALHGRILRHLIKPDLVGTQDPHIIRKSFVGCHLIPDRGAGAWFSAHAAFVIYLLTPLFFVVPPNPLAPSESARNRMCRMRAPLR